MPKPKIKDLNDLHQNQGTEAVRLVVENPQEPDDVIKQDAPRPLMREMLSGNLFPVDALGALLKPAAEAIQDKTKAPIAICSQSVLAAATLALQAQKNLVLPNGQVRPLSGFYMTIAETGERKSSCDYEALRPIRAYEKILRDKHAPEYIDFQNKKEAWETVRNRIKSKAKGDWAAVKAALDALGAAPLPPLTPVLTCSDPTIEGLCKLMAHGLPAIGMFSAEGGAFIGGHGMSQDNKTKTASILSLFWDGATVDRVRSGDGVTFLTGKRCTMHMMAQPDIAAIMLTDPVLQAQGLLSRFLVTAPQSTSGTRFWQEPKPETEGVIQRYEAHLLNILRLPLPLAEGKTNELAPPAMPLSPDAAQAWVKFHDHIERNTGNGGSFAPIRGLANKLPEHATRLAAVLTLVSDPQAGAITAQSLECGILLAEHYASEALRLFESSAVDHKLLTAQKLLTWLQTGWEESMVSLPDIYQRGPRSIRDKKTAADMVRILEDHGWLAYVGNGVVAGETRKDVWRVVRR